MFNFFLQLTNICCIIQINQASERELLTISSVAATFQFEHVFLIDHDNLLGVDCGERKSGCLVQKCCAFFFYRGQRGNFKNVRKIFFDDVLVFSFVLVYTRIDVKGAL